MAQGLGCDFLEDTGQKLKKEQEKKQTSSHLFIKGDQTVAYEDDDTSIVGRHTYDVASISAKDDDAVENPTYDDYGDMKKPNSFPMYDVDDDMNSTPHPIYDKYDDACRIVSGADGGWELGVKEDISGAELVEEN